MGVPGVERILADSRHHRSGRTVAWPDLLVQHHTDGWDSLAWLTTSPNSNVSSHYLTWHNGTVRAQLVRHRDTAHTNLHYNPRTITVEWERYWTDPARRQHPNFVPDSVYVNLAELWVEIIRVERQRGNPHFSSVGRNQMLGHRDLLSSTCPGNLDIGKLYETTMRLLETVDAPEPEDPHTFFPETGYYLSHGFLGYWRDNGGLAIFGLPLSREFDYTDESTSKTFTAQYLERTRFEYQPEIAGNSHGVVLGRIAAESMDAVREKYPNAFTKPDQTKPAPGDPPKASPVSLDSWIPVSEPHDVPASSIVAVCYQHNRTPAYQRGVVEEIADSIVKRSVEFGFRVSIMAGKTLHETGFFRYGNQVKAEQFNFAGLGADNSGAAGLSFDTVDDGVLAVMCHEALYVYGEPDRWPEHVRKYADRAIRLQAVRDAHATMRKPDGSLLRYLGTVTRIRDYVNGRWAQTDSVPLGTLENGYARSLVRVSNEVISA